MKSFTSTALGRSSPTSCFRGARDRWRTDLSRRSPALAIDRRSATIIPCRRVSPSRFPTPKMSEYAERAFPQYAHAVEMAGGEAGPNSSRPATRRSNETDRSCDAVLLPGSKADVDPAKYKAATRPEDCPRRSQARCHRRAAVAGCLPPAQAGARDLLRSANPERVSSRNACCSTSSRRSITRREERADRTHGGGGYGNEAEPDCYARAQRGTRKNVSVAVNSSHHQSAEAIGEGLRIVARCPQDGIIEAIEGTAPDHFVVAVQWHPERSVEDDESSRAIFRALVEAARR